MTDKNSVKEKFIFPVSAENLSENMSLHELREYIRAMVMQRGFKSETPQDIVLLMVEEVGELAKAVRKLIGLKIDQNKLDSYSNVEEEIADIFIYLLDLCVVFDIDLLSALKNKELKNEKRFFASVINK